MFVCLSQRLWSCSFYEVTDEHLYLLQVTKNSEEGDNKIEAQRLPFGVWGAVFIG